MSIKLKLYKLLVNRNPYIKIKYERYVNENPERHGKYPLLSWCYLAWLNITGGFPNKAEENPGRTKLVLCESKESFDKSPDELADILCEYGMVSFDIFDTLIFRPFSAPTDLFYVVGARLGIPDFRKIRIEAERKAREISEHGEISLSDIYNVLEKLTGISADVGIRAELESEATLCYANPYMLSVWNKCLGKGARIAVTSDMYLPSEFISELLRKNGFVGFERIFVSCEHGCGKYGGGLFQIVKKALSSDMMIHIGDNHAADVNGAEKAGIKAVYYPNVNHSGNRHRTIDMSYITGSAYRGIVNPWLYSGYNEYTPAYEYGFKVGGILALGYCKFIHFQAELRNSDKILFFSRDGYILKKIYDKLFPNEKTEYVYWSRTAAAKLSADIFLYDYYRRFIFQKVNCGYKIKDILEAMELVGIETGLAPDELLTSNNANALRDALTEKKEEINIRYSDMNKVVCDYFSKLLSDCSHVLTVDCGWAGSGGIIFDALVNKKWGLDCKVTSVVAGYNSAYQPDSDFSETFLKQGDLVSYCFSSVENRDIYKKHMPSVGHNIYFELLFGAPEPSFRGYYSDNGRLGLRFDSEAENLELINEIHKGELDFADEYIRHFSDVPLLYDISGSDAYAPFMQAASDGGKYFNELFKSCVFDEQAGGRKNKL
ncbi:MAG: HAD-IA family hydrolase [Oscillospiraceae bacterium]|nr:HAD-IA family hydrolase [Oscillospiraceae bacterium]